MSASRNIADSRGATVVAAVGLVLAVFGYFALLAPYGLELADEGHIVHQIYRTYLGQRPYLDFHTGYTPGTYYWNAALFHLFGVNLLVLRLCLAVVHTLSVGCMYWLARRIGLPSFVAVVPGLVYVALIPFHDGGFAPFNIPYPAWYVTLCWLAGVIAVVRWWERGTLLPLLLSGAAAGAAFSFKPNSGLLSLAVALFAVTLLQRPASQALPPDGLRRALVRSERLLRWAVPLLLAGALTSLFAVRMRLVWLFALPLLVLVACHLFLPRTRAIARVVAPLALWRDLVVLGAGFAGPVLPWVLAYWAQLGTVPFLRTVLYIGTDYERFYLIDYPSIGMWGIALSAVIGAVVAIGAMVSRGWLSRRLVVGTAVMGGMLAAAWVLSHPPRMVEGFQRSVAMRIQDVTLTVLLFFEWSAIAAHVVQMARGRSVPVPLHDAVAGQGRRRFEAQGGAFGGGVFLILLLSAVLMYMQLYPRSDYVHAVFSAPGILILAGWLLGVGVRWWVPGPRVSPRIRYAVAGALAAPVYALVLVLLAPDIGRIAYLVEAELRDDAAALVRLESPRAPVLVESTAGATLAGLGEVTRYLQSHSRPQDFVFTFPCLDYLAFLADRRDPTEHGYYYPGSPGHAVEAAVIDSLRARQPPYVVALHDHALFFVAAPIYYFNLNDYIGRHYRLERRIGSFDVLRRIDAAAQTGKREPAAPDRAGATAPAVQDARPETELAAAIRAWRGELQLRRGTAVRRVDAALSRLPAPEVGALATAIEGMDRRAQRTVADLIRRSRSAEGAAALAVVFGRPSVSAIENDLFVRIMVETADLQVVGPLLAKYPEADVGSQLAISGVLFTVASRAWVEGYWFAPSRAAGIDGIDPVLPTTMLVSWINDPWQGPALRSFAVHMAGQLGRGSAVPFLVRLLGDPNEMRPLRMDAAQSLVRLGLGRQVLPSIGGLLLEEPLIPAVLTLRLVPEAPRAAQRVVIEAMRSDDQEVRSNAFWMAAGMRAPQLLPALKRGLRDPVREVQIAAVWGLGNTGGADAAALLDQIARDGNDELRAFAERSIDRLGR